MQTEIDLDAAAAAGILNEHQALMLRNFEAERAGQSAANSEKFQFYGGLTDIMSAAGLGFALWGVVKLCGVSIMSMLYAIVPVLLFIAAAKLKQRAYPFTTMILMLGCLGFASIASPAILNFAIPEIQNYLYFKFSYVPSTIFNHNILPILVILSGLIPGVAVGWKFWKKFRFPATPAAIAGIFISAIAVYFLPSYDANRDFSLYNWGIFTSSLVTLGVALWWDISDIRRETLRSQVAFWLHCIAGFLIVRSSFGLLAGQESEIFGDYFLHKIEIGHIGAFALICALCVTVSLLIDRRSLLLSTVFPSIIVISQIASEAFSLLFTGFALVIFSWGWKPMRQLLLGFLSQNIVAQLPRTETIQLGQRPTRRHKQLEPRSLDATSKGIKMLFGTKSD